MHNVTGARPPVEVKHRLRIAREYAELDQETLAEQMGVTRSTVSNAEQGKGDPRRTTINAWAQATGVSVDWLLSGDMAASA
jgi:transcriptional regulator with XRE-family HTH domain